MKKKFIFIFIVLSTVSFGQIVLHNLKESSTENKSMLSTTDEVGATCENAIVINSSSGSICETPVKGVVKRYQKSNLRSGSCTSMPTVLNEVWYEFKATSTSHMLQLKTENNSGPVYVAVYNEDVCSLAADPLICTKINAGDSSADRLENLVIGKKYKIRVFVDNLFSVVRYEICLIISPKYIKTSTNEYTNEELIKKVLINNNCLEISDISSKTGLDFNTAEELYNPNGIGFFSQNGSNFPFKNGIVLSTGNVLKASGPKYSVQTAGNKKWLGDEDLKALLEQNGIESNLVNASSLTFTFKALTNKIGFNYIFASEEYGQYQCNYSDAFAFILTDLQTGEKKNLAVVPGTNTPVSVTTIRNQRYNNSCHSVNPEYFNSFTQGTGQELSDYQSPINFRGSTVPLRAESDVVPGKKYQIKLVISDNGNRSETYDSAVFIESSGFNTENIDLGSDRLFANKSALCPEEKLILNTKLATAQYEFKWTKDNVALVTETKNTLEVNQPGIYAVQAKIKNTNCVLSDTVKVEIYPSLLLDKPLIYEICALKNKIPTQDLTKISSELLAKNKGLNKWAISYFSSEKDAQADENEIKEPKIFVPKALPAKIFIKIKHKESGCKPIITFFDLVKKPWGALEKLKDISTCVLDEKISPVSFEVIEKALQNKINKDVEVSYYSNLKDATELENPIVETKNYIAKKLPQKIYISLVDKIKGCQFIGTFQIISHPKKPIYKIENTSVCYPFALPEIPQDHYFSSEKYGKGKKINSKEILSVGKHIFYINTNNPQGCIFSEQIEIDVKNCRPSKGISPDGDGINDTFDLTFYKPLSVIIYNRYGKVVYSHKGGYTNQWYGQSNSGQKLPAGTYFYKITTSSEEFSGYVQLVRAN